MGLEAGGYVSRHSAERLEADLQGRRPETGKERFEHAKGAKGAKGAEGAKGAKGAVRKARRVGSQFCNTSLKLSQGSFISFSKAIISPAALAVDATDAAAAAANIPASAGEASARKAAPVTTLSLLMLMLMPPPPPLPPPPLLVGWSLLAGEDE